MSSRLYVLSPPPSSARWKRRLLVAVYRVKTSLRPDELGGGEGVCIAAFLAGKQASTQAAIDLLTTTVDTAAATVEDVSSTDDRDDSGPICRGGGAYSDCPCQGFKAGGRREDPSPFICRRCLHNDSDHSR